MKPTLAAFFLLLISLSIFYTDSAEAAGFYYDTRAEAQTACEYEEQRAAYVWRACEYWRDQYGRDHYELIVWGGGYLTRHSFNPLNCTANGQLFIGRKGFYSNGWPNPPPPWPRPTCSSNAPDLVATINASSPLDDLGPGSTISVDVEISNISAIAFPNRNTFGVYLTRSDEQPALGTDTSLASQFYNYVYAGAANTRSSTHDIVLPDSITPGDHKIWVVANIEVVQLHQQGTAIVYGIEEDYDNNFASFDLIIAGDETPDVQSDAESAALTMSGCKTDPANQSDPVDVRTGEQKDTEIDYVGAGPFPLLFERYYRSQSNKRRGWSTSYSSRIEFGSGMPTSGFVRFDDGSGIFVEDVNIGAGGSDVKGRLTKVGNDYVYTDGNDVKRRYDADGRLIQVTNRAGFSQTLSYAGDQLLAVTDQFGRAITFTYDADGLLTSMTDPAGAVYRYDYHPENEDGEHLLASVSYPDATPEESGDNPTRHYIYDSPFLLHGLTGIIDENGNRFATFEYDDQGRSVFVTHANGVETTTFSYGELSATVTNSFGKSRTFQFVEINGGIKMASLAGAATASCPYTSIANTHDDRGYITSTTNKRGFVTQYAYAHDDLAPGETSNHIGLETRRTVAVGTPEERTITTTWHPDFRLPATITVPGRTTEFEYDAAGRPVTVRAIALDTGDVRETQYAYNSAGLIESVDGPRTDALDITRFEYNALGELTRTINALGQVTEVTGYDVNGLPTQIVDANGVETRLTYDARRRLTALTQVSEIGDLVTAFGYDAANNLVQVTAPDGSHLYYSYNAAHLLTSVTNDLGESLRFELDTEGNRTRQTTLDSGSNIVRAHEQVFDELSRLRQSIGAAGQTTTLGYDKNGNNERVIDALGQETSMHFDALDRLTSMTDALDGESTLSYDNRDNLTSVTDAEGVTTTYVYNSFDELVEEQSTASGVTRHRYDSAGNRIQSINANGVVTDYRYDALNRLVETRYPGSPEENISYRYDEGDDGVGRLTTFTDASGESHFSYDDRGNLVIDERVIEDQAYTTYYEYDRANRLTEMVYPSGRILHYELDALGRVTQVTTQQTAASPIQVVAGDFSYLPFGPATSWRHGNGVATSIDYDLDYRITGIDVEGAATVLSTRYHYDDVSNITAILDTLGIDSQAFAYDPLNRLTFAEGSYGTIDYGYDGVGNRLTRTVASEAGTTTEAYAYEAGSHRLMAVAATETRPAKNGRGTEEQSSVRQLGYDAAGNTITDSSDTRDLAVSINARNRMAAIDDDGDRIGEYSYNALGQRVAKWSRHQGRLHVSATNGQAGEHPAQAKSGQSKVWWSGNVHGFEDQTWVTEQIHFQYDQAGNIIAESDEAGHPIREYIYIGNFRIAMAANDESFGNGQGQRPEAKLYYLHNDHLGTPQNVTDADQNILWTMRQTPFGEINDNGNQITLPMRFPGQYADAESGFHYNYFRDYDPSLGRYVQSDPIGWTGGVNAYAYAQSNPQKYLDPNGLEILLQAHPVITFTELQGLVVGSINHTKVTIFLEPGSRFSGDPRFSNTDAQGRRYLTIGAGPDSASSVLGKLQGSLNRSKDIDLSSNVFSTSVFNFCSTQESEDNYIALLLSAQDVFNDNLLEYSLFPSGRGQDYNSNSYISGLLKSVGINVAAPPNTPGFSKPVPPNHF